MSAYSDGKTDIQRDLRRTPTPIRLYWTIDEDYENNERPVINVSEDAPIRADIFDAYGVDSVTELAAELMGEHPTGPDRLRVGVVANVGDDATFYHEQEVLATVDGISDEIAGHLIEWYNDVPGLCKRVRQDQYLTTLFHDAKVELDDASWLDEFEVEDLEWRLKQANVWVEPQDAVA